MNKDESQKGELTAAFLESAFFKTILSPYIEEKIAQNKSILLLDKTNLIDDYNKKIAIVEVYTNFKNTLLSWAK